MDLLTYVRIITRLHLHHIEFPLVGPVPLPFPFLFAFPLDDLRLHLHHIELPLVGPVPLPFPFLFAFPLHDLLLPPQVVQLLKIVNYAICYTPCNITCITMQL